MSVGENAVKVLVDVDSDCVCWVVLELFIGGGVVKVVSLRCSRQSWRSWESLITTISPPLSLFVKLLFHLPWQHHPCRFDSLC